MSTTETTTQSDKRPTEEVNLLSASPPPLPTEQNATKSYLAWLRSECPVDSVSFGTITFHKFIDVEDGDGKRYPMPGQILELTDRQIEHASEDLKTRVLRNYYVTVNGVRKRRGQEDVGLYRWNRPGKGPDGAPFLDPETKQPVTKPTLVLVTNARTSPNDEPWTKYVVLEPATEDMRKFYDRMGRKSAVDVLAEARAFNAAQAEREQSLAAEAGISTARGTMSFGRID